MKKWLLLIILTGFILSSLIAISYTNQVISTFNFDENGGEDNGSEAGFKIDCLNIKSQKSEVNLIWSEYDDGQYVDVAHLHAIQINHSNIHLSSLGVIQNNSLNHIY